jgi:glucuronate isomerase
MSFPRHEYFRRMLCRMLGQEMESGLIPHDETSIGHLLTALCHRNAEIFFGLNE